MKPEDLPNALRKRFAETRTPTGLADTPPDMWHHFIKDGWILLVYHNHPNVEPGQTAVGFFDPTNKGRKP